MRLTAAGAQKRSPAQAIVARADFGEDRAAFKSVVRGPAVARASDLGAALFARNPASAPPAVCPWFPKYCPTADE